MKLVLPNIDYKEQAIQYIKEFKEYGSEVNGSGALDSYLEESTYEEWLQKVRGDIDIANILKPRVPALTYFYVREEEFYSDIYKEVVQRYVIREQSLGEK